MVGETGAQERIRHPRCFRHGDSPAIQEGARAVLRREQFIAIGIEHNPRDQFSRFLKSQRDIPHRIGAVSEIRGAVERVHIPAIFGSALAATAFFGDNGMLGKFAAQALYNVFLGGLIGFGQQVILSPFISKDTRRSK